MLEWEDGEAVRVDLEQSHQVGPMAKEYLVRRPVQRDVATPRILLS